METDLEKNYDVEMKLKMIENGLRYLADLDLFDTFYDKIWSKDIPRLLETYMDEKSYHDIPIEENDEVKRHIVEWFG